MYDFNRTFASLDEIPDQPGGLAPTSYVEGMNGLANRGLLVTDTETGKKYKVLILSNTGSTLKFRYRRV